MFFTSCRISFLTLALLLFWGVADLYAQSPKEGVLLVAFGTSVPEAKKALAAIDAEYRKEFPGVPLVWSYTSQIIRKKLAKEGIEIGSIGEGLEKLAKEGVKIVRVQSLHIMAGEEFAGLVRSILTNLHAHPGRFEAVYLGRPLLETENDAREVAAAVLQNMGEKRQEGEALALMGHGQAEGRADLVFEGARSIFKSMDPLVFMATVEGSRNFADMAREMKKANVKRVMLAPLMVVAGDHARNDLAGDDDESWAKLLKAQGYEVRTNLRGLGELPEISRVFIRHTRDSKDNLVTATKP